jgi:hypothetical protein
MAHRIKSYDLTLEQQFQDDYATLSAATSQIFTYRVNDYQLLE